MKRFISFEPLLEKIHLPELCEFDCECDVAPVFVGDVFPDRGINMNDHNDEGWKTCCGGCHTEKLKLFVDYSFIGCESGSGARLCDVKHIAHLVNQLPCPVGIKQIPLNGKCSKFEDRNKWPEDLQVWEM